jgi:phage recombination protein Bet
MTTKTKEPKKQEKAIVQWKGEAITITFRDVKSLICPLATDQETAVFLKTCQSLQLNPFAGEVYLIKYSERDKAATVIAIDSYLKAGETNPQFDGFESGIILKDSTGELKFREGAFLLDEERAKLVGGWAKVYRKDRSRPFYVAVNKKECLRYRRDGSLTEFWTEEKQPSMLRKVALKRALVEAFPSLFSGVISNVDYEALPEEVKEAVPEPKGETQEGELPPAYERNGEAYWKLWWARQKEKGLSAQDVHDILGITSLKEDWIDTGRTLEEAEDIISKALPLVTRGKKLGLSINQISDMLGMSLRECFTQGKSVDEAVKVISEKLAKPKAGVAVPAAEEAGTGAATPAKPKRDPSTIKTIQDLYKACHEDWGLQPKDVLKELGISSQSDIADTPANCYRQIAAVHDAT